MTAINNGKTVRFENGAVIEFIDTSGTADVAHAITHKESGTVSWTEPQDESIRITEGRQFRNDEVLRGNEGLGSLRMAFKFTNESYDSDDLVARLRQEFNNGFEVLKTLRITIPDFAGATVGKEFTFEGARPTRGAEFTAGNEYSTLSFEFDFTDFDEDDWTAPT